MQKVLIMTTDGPGMKSHAQGWDYVSGDSIITALNKYGPKYGHNPNLIPIGLINGCENHYPDYASPLHAIGDNWKLLVPPTKLEYIAYGDPVTEYEWWFVKD